MTASDNKSGSPLVVSLEQHIQCRDYLFILNWVGLRIWGRGTFLKAVPISSAATVLVFFFFSTVNQVANSEIFFPTIYSFHKGFHIYVRCITNSPTTAKMLLYLYFICNFLFLSLMRLTRDLSIFLNSFGKIFGFVNHCYFLQPSFMDFYPFHYVNPSDFTGSENVVRMSSILRTQGPSGLECDPLLQKFHVCPQNRHFVFSGYKFISHVI